MIHAYDEEYLPDAIKNLGEAVDYAVSYCQIETNDFFDLFIASGLADQFGRGVPKIISGLSGTELVLEVFRQSGVQRPFPEPQEDYDYSCAYWCGWIIAYYQWYSGIPFRDIFQSISAEELEHLYPTLHEASEEKCVDTLNRMILRDQGDSKLKVQRVVRNYTQKELADRTGISLRTIQHYEQRSKDLNRASGTTLSVLAQTLGCRIEDLLEIDVNELEDEDE
ncbi:MULTISPECIES: helix-turn-helix domain-containing protein [unclassified Ruminococcus]|uniref:helix-turn-helix domain-containing protein n=1 Tax=unclassified Ruminococcus TaxID=2608920 RepID=UPI00210A00CB|nr:MULTISPECIES: helix-turn-helix transcriptional regulator [unclassified Ruminococcus]MCQ4023211.1 helix-turn-helix domain-containing protein [Ruminococcus sp. zg-924]MCQ4115592.1 helix-turn-helix domain-containing protein [Ruminococcus sp. zg-921]